MLSADTNLFLYAANPGSPHHGAANAFFNGVGKNSDFVVCELVLVEIYMQLRNPAVMPAPLSSKKAAEFCGTLRSHPHWQHVDYCPDVGSALWDWASTTTAGFRKIIDARLAFTLLFHGVEEFATANTKDFEGFSFDRVWNPLTGR